MNTKEAIDFVEMIPCNGMLFDPKSLENRKKQLIDLLQRGEKYEAKWQTLLEDLDFMPNKKKLLINWEDINNMIIKIEQKYFPKEDNETN